MQLTRRRAIWTPVEARASWARHVVVAEDDRELRDALCRALRKRAYNVVGVGNGAALVGHVHRHFLAPDLYPRVDIAITDLGMPSTDGFAALARLRELDPALTCLVITAHDDDESVQRVKQLGADALLCKPFTLGEFDELIALLVGAVRSAT
jgi:two-component system response regulator DctR